MCSVIFRKHVEHSTVKEPEIEEITSEDQRVLTEEEEKKKADSLWSGMVVVISLILSLVLLWNLVILVLNVIYSSSCQGHYVVKYAVCKVGSKDHYIIVLWKDN
jgi:hypothetical protein